MTGKSQGEVIITHTIPKMTDTEREKSKKLIGNDLYEIFLRIQAQLNIDNEPSPSENGGF